MIDCREVRHMKRIENEHEQRKNPRRRARAQAEHQLDMFSAPISPGIEPGRAAQEPSLPGSAAIAVPDPEPRAELNFRPQAPEISEERSDHIKPAQVHQQKATESISEHAPTTARRAQARSLRYRSLPALTRRQHDLLHYLEQRELRGERPPSLTEICRDLGLVSRGSLHKQVVALVQAGLVEPMNGKQRGVRLIKPQAVNDDCALPLLGVIAAGQPIEALLRDESVVLPGWLRGPGGRYALRVRGDSMRDTGILDGDIVVIEPRQSARNGETVVALIDGEAATLKRIEQHPGVVLLHAENPAFPPQRYAPEQVQIQGVVVAALRRYS